MMCFYMTSFQSLPPLFIRFSQNEIINSNKMKDDIKGKKDCPIISYHPESAPVVFYPGYIPESEFGKVLMFRSHLRPSKSELLERGLDIIVLWKLLG